MKLKTRAGLLFVLPFSMLAFLLVGSAPAQPLPSFGQRYTATKAMVAMRDGVQLEHCRLCAQGQ